MSRRAIAIVLVGVGMLLSGPIPSAIEASGQPAILTDSIAPGIVTGSLGLGTGSVAVAADGYVTLFVRSSPALANRTVQIWQEHSPNSWSETVTRRFAADGTLRYFVRITSWTALQARYAADHTQPPVQSHGRIAAVEPRDRSVLTASCSDFSSAAGGPNIIRAVGVTLGSTVEVDACAGDATGSWSLAPYDHQAIHLETAVTTPALRLATWVVQVRQSGSDALEFDYRASGLSGPRTWSLTVLLQMDALRVTVTTAVAFTPLVPCGPSGRCQIRLDIYGPGAAGIWPVVVLLRGGPGGLGSRADYAAFATRIASQGIVVFNADYRDDAASGGLYPRAFDDAACAVRFARANAVAHGGNPAAVTVVGHSLGAYVGSIVALSANAFAGPCLASGSGAPNTFVGISGPYLLAEQNLQADFASVLGGTRATNPRAWQGGDPFGYVGRRPGVIFRLVHGSEDRTVEPAASNALEAALEKMAFDTSLTVVPGASHTSLIDQDPDVELTMAVILGAVR